MPAEIEVLERCKTDRLIVKPGRNVWIIARSDRDAPTEADLIATCGAFLSRVLGYASEAGHWDPTDILQDPEPPSGALAAWYIGAARPVLLTKISHAMPLDQSFGGRLGRSIECDFVRLIEADKPIFLVVEFDWRGPTTWTSWPASKVNSLGFRSKDTRRTDLDWLVIEAWHRGDAQDPDSTWSDELTTYAEKKAKKAAKALGDGLQVSGKVLLVGAVVAAALFFAVGYARRSPHSD